MALSRNIIFFIVATTPISYQDQRSACSLEVRGQRTKRQRSDVRCRKSEGQRSEVRRRKDRGRMSDVGSQKGRDRRSEDEKTEVGCQMSEVRRAGGGRQRSGEGHEEGNLMNCQKSLLHRSDILISVFSHDPDYIVDNFLYSFSRKRADFFNQPIFINYHNVSSPCQTWPWKICFTFPEKNIPRKNGMFCLFCKGNNHNSTKFASINGIPLNDYHGSFICRLRS